MLNLEVMKKEVRRAAMDILRDTEDASRYVLKSDWDLASPDTWEYPTSSDLVTFWASQFDLDRVFVRKQRRFFLILFKLFVRAFYCELKAGNNPKDLEYLAFSKKFDDDVMFSIESVVDLSTMYAKGGSKDVVKARMNQARNRLIFLNSAEKGGTWGYGKVPVDYAEPEGKLVRVSRAQRTPLHTSENNRRPVSLLSQRVMTPIMQKSFRLKKESDSEGMKRRARLLLKQWYGQIKEDLRLRPESFDVEELRHAYRLLGQPIPQSLARFGLKKRVALTDITQQVVMRRR